MNIIISVLKVQSPTAASLSILDRFSSIEEWTYRSSISNTPNLQASVSVNKYRTTDLFGDESALYEPGYTRVVELKIKNAGSLALKYKIGMNIVSETAGTNKAGDSYKLSDYLKVATTAIQDYDIANGSFSVAAVMESLIFDRGDYGMWTESAFTDFELEKDIHGVIYTMQPGAEEILGMKVYMPEAVGNEANAISAEKAASISFGINVAATQYTYEHDSFNNQYDKDATYLTYPSNVTTKDFEEAASVAYTDINGKVQTGNKPAVAAYVDENGATKYAADVKAADGHRALGGDASDKAGKKILRKAPGWFVWAKPSRTLDFYTVHSGLGGKSASRMKARRDSFIAVEIGGKICYTT